MELYLVRHAQTAGNAEGRYVGRTDIPITELGERRTREIGGFAGVETVYVSPMLRARQTAALLFPNAEQIPLEGLAEMDFGEFEDKTDDELSGDKRYRAWLDSGGLLTCPGGEDYMAFGRRVEDALAEMVARAVSGGRQRAVAVTHGGAIMAVMSRCARPQGLPFDYMVGNCGGFRITVDDSFPQQRVFCGHRKLDKLDFPPDAGK